MAALSDFLSALFAGCPDEPITLVAATEAELRDGAEIEAFVADAGDEPIYVRPLAAGVVAFLHAVTENVRDPDEWRDLSMAPTAVLFKDGTMITVFALEQAVEPTEEVAALYAAMGGDLDDMIPTPGANGWDLVHCDPEAFQPIDALFDVYSSDTLQPQTADVAPWEDEPAADFGQFNDAHLLTHYDPADPYYAQDMIISIGAGRESIKWTPKTMPVTQFIDMLSHHREEAKKDGLAFVLAEIVGPNRRKIAVKACYGVGLDIDVGVSGAQIDKALAEMGHLAVRYTTHSHCKTATDFRKDRLIKYADEIGGDLEDPTVISRFLREKEHWDESIVASAEYVGDEHQPEGLMARINHDPMPKHRVVMPLAQPFNITEVAKTQEEGMKLWNEVPKALARMLGDLPLDKAALDPSRLFYFPRHAKGRPHETTIFGGPMLDWHELDLDNTPTDAFEAALEQEVGKKSGKSRSSTKEGQALGRWSIKAAHGFQIVDVIRDHCEDRIRTNGATKIDLECPFDEEHGNPGDPEDKGCFAVNAGDGPSEIFTIRCAHDSCQERTNLDHLGKMIKDGWFGAEMLEDQSYNAAEPEEAQQPEAAAKIAAEDDARAEYLMLIEALTDDSDDAQVDVAIAAMIEANLEGRAKEKAETAARKNLKMTALGFKNLLKSVRKAVVGDQNKSGGIKDPKGRLVFAFPGEFNFDEAFDICFKALLNTNAIDAEPTFSCVQDKPVRLSRNPKSGRITWDELTNRTLWSELNKRVTFVRHNDQGDGARQSVPREVADHVYEQAYTELPQSPEIIYTPIFTQAGDLIVQPGYYADLNILMANTRFEITVPENVTAEQAEESVRFLKEDLLVDFPFLDYDLEGNERREPSEANCLAMILTPFMRRMINGVTPVFFVAKPTPGTGGTLLGKLPMLIFDGAESAPMRYTQNEEEMQKALLAAIMETRSHLFFDDVKDFNNRSLLQSITAQEIGGRMLGVSRNVSRPNLFNWIGTGNNPIIGSEMERRICWIRLNLKVSDIQTRVYVHPDLPGWVAEHRAKIIGHILTMIQYWIEVGCPEFEERKRASFEDWSRKVGGVLQACGVEGFLDNRRSAGADMDETAIRTFIKEWLKKFGFEKTLPSKLFEYAVGMELDVIEGNNDDQKKQRFPKRLHTLDGRVFALDGVDYMVMTGFDHEDNLTYYLSPLHGVEAVEDPVEEPIAA